MTKTRKILVIILSAIMALGLSMSVFAFTGCGGEAATLTSITLDTKEMKTVYVVGDKVNTTGIKVTANYSDKTTKELSAGAYTIADVDKTLTVKNDFMSTNFQSSQTFVVSYTEGEVTKTRSFSVTVTNKIVTATVNEDKSNYADKYFVGQQFNPKGLVLNATLEDGTTQEIAVTSSNATFSPSGALSNEVESITVTIGGKDVQVPIEMQNGIYIEAETGYRDGSLIEQSTGDQGNLRTDATTEDAQGYATDLYEAHLKAEFAVASMKAAAEEAEEEWDETLAETPATAAEIAQVLGGEASVYKDDVTVGGEIVSKLYLETVKWLKNTANAEAIAEYVGGEDYAALLEAFVNGENEDIDEWNYEDLVEKFTASGEGSGGNEYYLGQNNQGNVISFVFESSAATDTGMIAFRLASAYLYADNGSWVPVIMGDVDFNKLCEFYVNGVKQTIPDGTILKGSKTEDGSSTKALWVNWDTVTFENVALVEGRNVIELKILNHGITAQEGYSFAANVDTLIVSPGKDATTGDDASRLNTYSDEGITATSTVTGVSIAKVTDDDDEAAVVMVNGTYAASKAGEDAIKGYLDDLVSNQLGIAVGNTNANIELKEGNTFEATVNVTAFDFGDYNVTVGGKKIELPEFADAKITVGRNDYTLTSGENGISLNIDSLYKVENITSAIAAPVVSLEERGGKPYMVITGGTYTFDVEGFDLDNDEDLAEVNAILAQKIKAQWRFEAQNNPDDGSFSGWDNVIRDGNHIITILDDKTFEVSVDISAAKNGGAYGLHFNHCNEDGSFPTGNGDNDFAEKNFPGFTTSPYVSLESNGLLYESFYNVEGHSFSWGCVCIIVSNPNAPQFNTNTTVTFETEEDKMYVVASGTYKNYDDVDALKAAVFQSDDAQKSDWSVNVDLTEKTKVVVNEEAGTYKIMIEVTELANGQYLIHMNDGDLFAEGGIDELKCGNKVFSYENVNFGTWSRYCLTIKDAPEDPEPPVEGGETGGETGGDNGNETETETETENA